MGKKVKTCISISGTDPQKLLKEISKVEGRRVVKSTNCNDRSSRSHCMVTLDVPEVGGKLVLVDMAGSENVEQAGLGRELKMQTGKINQGNGALKRVVEAIANGDSYIPYRDSKLTMLLQDSFEDDRAKILMILCASPDIRDLHKTICTLEYGAKAKCIVRLSNSPSKSRISAAGVEQVQILEARLTKKDAYIENLRKQKEEREKELESKDKELAELREEAKRWNSEKEPQRKRKGLHDGDTEDLNSSPTRKQKIEELTALVLQQQREIDLMRIRAEKAEAELLHIQRSYNLNSNARVGHTRVENSDSKEGVGVEDLNKRVPSLTHGSAISNQRFQDIQKLMNDRILAAQAESDRIIAQYRPEQAVGERSGQRNTQCDLKVKPCGNSSATESQKQDRDNGSTSPCEVMSLTSNSASLLLLKNLVKEKERRLSLSAEEETLRPETNAINPSAPVREDPESDDWMGEKLCSKGWLPIIPEEDERIAQSVEVTKSVTPQGSSDKDHSMFWTQVTPDTTNPANQGSKDAGSNLSLTFASPEEQLSTAIASYFNNSGLDGSPLLPCGGSGSRDGPSSRDNFAAGVKLCTASSEFVFGVSKEWAQEEDQHDQRLAAQPVKVPSLLTVLAEPARTCIKNPVEEAGSIGSMRLLDESGGEVLDVPPVEPVLLNLGTDLFDGGQSGGNDAEAARRARIETIFMLCGENRERARKANVHTFAKESEEAVPEVLSGRYSLTSSSYGSQHFADSQLDQSVSDFSTSPSYSEAAYYTDVSVSSLPSLMPTESPQRFPSSRRPTRRMSSSIFANENSQPKPEDEKIDVYVKWEKSSDLADGKLICIINVPKTSSLSELREEIEAHIPVSKRNFKFLFRGETGGAPVDQEFESDVRVESLPASHDDYGSRLAWLRPPAIDTDFVNPRVESAPFRSLENQLDISAEQVNVSMTKFKGTSLPSHGRAGPPLGHTKGLRSQNGETVKPKSALAHIVNSTRCI